MASASLLVRFPRARQYALAASLLRACVAARHTRVCECALATSSDLKFSVPVTAMLMCACLRHHVAHQSAQRDAGKLDLYVAAAGFNPARVLPIVLDVGTNNERLRSSPLYLGLKHPRIEGDAYYEVGEARLLARVCRVCGWERALRAVAFVGLCASVEGRVTVLCCTCVPARSCSACILSSARRACSLWMSLCALSLAASLTRCCNLRCVYMSTAALSLSEPANTGTSVPQRAQPCVQEIM